MLYKHENRYITMGGKYLSGGAVLLDFGVSGAGFPKSYPYPVENSNYRSGRLIIWSKTPNKVTINYGDGVVATHDFGFKDYNYRLYFADINTVILPGTRVEYHEYADLKTEKRVITMRFQSPDSITLINSSIMDIEGVFPASIDKLTSLERLDLQYTRLITSFPVTIANSKVTNLLLTQIGSALSNGIPVEFLNMPLKNFSVAGSTDLKDVNTSNFNKINKLAATLTDLYVSGCKIETLPTEITELTNLTTLYIDSNNYLSTPPEVNELTSLRVLRMAGGYAYNNTVTGWGDFRALVNLTNLYAQIAQYLSATLPAWFGELVKLKHFWVYGNYKTVERADEFVNSFYGIVTATAPISGTNADPFRGMSIEFHNTSQSGFANEKPSGIYQQPVDYVQGVSNGTPASPQEKIWVMVNQYGHSWILPA